MQYNVCHEFTYFFILKMPVHCVQLLKRTLHLPNVVFETHTLVTIDICNDLSFRLSLFLILFTLTLQFTELKISIVIFNKFG